MAVQSTPRRLMGMFLALFVLLQVTVAAQHGAHHQHHVQRSPEELSATFHETKALLEKRANNVAIVGAPGQHARLEIRQMSTRSDQWNLFLLAMERFKAKPFDDRLSYYQIAGIHGRPFITWNNMGPLTNAAGWCPHGQSLFGSWHRPYLALFEQAVYQNAEEVIETFPRGQQQRWRQALVGLRVPYFDWAMTPPAGQPNVPSVLRDENVSVTKPNGRVTIPNPLYSFSWGRSLPREMGGGPLNSWPSTLRRPSLTNSPRSNNDQMNVVFGQARVGWRQRVFALFASKQPFGRASSAEFGVRTSRSNRDSFESVHDEIHSTVGGNQGHMSYLDVASFDPLFWIHHVNVDRLLAMHQWVSSSYSVDGTINRPMAQWNTGDNKNINSPLRPFTKDTSGTFYNSLDVRETRRLGYFYPETESRNPRDVITAINRLYRQNEAAITKRHEHSFDAEVEVDLDGFNVEVEVGGVEAEVEAGLDGIEAELEAEVGDLEAEVEAELAEPVYPGRPFVEGDYDTVLTVVGDKYAIAGSYQVRCYLGNKPTANHTSSGNFTSGSGYGKGYVGSHTFLGGSSAGGNVSVLVEGSIPLTAALQEKEANGELKSLHPDEVEAYLEKHLSYVIIGPNGEIAPESLSKFQAKVRSCPVKPAANDDELPVFEDYIDLPQVKLPGSDTVLPIPSTPYVEDPESSPSEAPVSYPTGTMPSPGSLPWEEPGYCITKQTIQYVDPDGNLLYTDSY